MWTRVLCVCCWCPMHRVAGLMCACCVLSGATAPGVHEGMARAALQLPFPQNVAPPWAWSSLGNRGKARGTKRCGQFLWPQGSKLGAGDPMWDEPPLPTQNRKIWARFPTHLPSHSCRRGRGHPPRQEEATPVLCRERQFLGPPSGSQGLVSAGPSTASLPWREVADVKIHWEPGSTHPGSLHLW